MAVDRAVILIAYCLVALAGAPSLHAQEVRRSFVFTLATDSIDLAEVSSLVQQELGGPVGTGVTTGEFISGRIYPFGGPGRFLVSGVVSNPVSLDAYWVLHPFGAGLDDAPTRVLGPATTGDVVILR